MEMNQYQRSAVLTRQKPAKTEKSDPIVSLLGLVGEAGGLVTEYKKFLRDGDAYTLFPARVGEELGDILWYIASVADDFDLDLQEIADSNLAKCRDRWGNYSPTEPASFDSTFPKTERLPRRFEVTLTTFEETGRIKMRMMVNGKAIGDPLTDNAYEDDGYRFHDIFHLACVAVLGWSPVIRKLLECKRKSRQDFDEVEDGGRATAIEEGISALVFSYAADHDRLRGIRKIDFELLRTIKGMTKNLEVNARSYRDWEQTILRAYDVWREIREHQGGTVSLDLDARTLLVKVT